MKISEMTNDQAAKALIRMSEPVSRICDDEELIAMFTEFKNMESIGLVRAVGRILPKFTLYALERHKNDFYEVIGALSDKSAAAVAKMNFPETVKLVRDSYDDILRDFFTRSGIVSRKTEDA